MSSDTEHSQTDNIGAAADVAASDASADASTQLPAETVQGPAVDDAPWNIASVVVTGCQKTKTDFIANEIVQELGEAHTLGEVKEATRNALQVCVMGIVVHFLFVIQCLWGFECLVRICVCD
jgi:hypothetical protein